MQLSYSRRIRRPTYNDLSPFFTFSDSRNYAEGNPNLDPEFSNVFELGYLKSMDLGSVSASVAPLKHYGCPTLLHRDLIL